MWHVGSDLVKKSVLKVLKSLKLNYPNLRPKGALILNSVICLCLYKIDEVGKPVVFSSFGTEL